MQNGVVATDHPICSQVGVNILQIGNAADAAIASALCLGVVNPTSSGIGGGAFILIHSDAKEAKGDDIESPLFEDARSQQSRMKDMVMTARNNPESNSSDKAKQYTPSQKRRVTEFIDCRETAPRRSTFDMFEKNYMDFDKIISNYSVFTFLNLFIHCFVGHGEEKKRA